MTKKSKTATLPPSAAEVPAQNVTPAAGNADAVDQFDNSADFGPSSRFVGVFHDKPLEDYQPPPTVLASDALEHAANLLGQAQHSEFSSHRHRAIQLIAEARTLLEQNVV